MRTVLSLVLAAFLLAGCAGIPGSPAETSGPDEWRWFRVDVVALKDDLRYGARSFCDSGTSREQSACREGYWLLRDQLERIHGQLYDGDIVALRKWYQDVQRQACDMFREADFHRIACRRL